MDELYLCIKNSAFSDYIGKYSRRLQVPHFGRIFYRVNAPTNVFGKFINQRNLIKITYFQFLKINRYFYIQ